MLIVCSDFLEPDGIESGLRFIAGRGDELVCMQLLAPEEIDPVAAGLSGDLRLADVETGGTVEVTVTPALLRAYTKRLDAWCSTLRANCVRRGIGHLTVPTDTSIETVLVEMMRKEGFVR